MAADWRTLLAAEAARTSIAATARRLGYSRTAVSLALAGKYPGNTKTLAAVVLEVLGRVDCPCLDRPVTPAWCAATARGPVPTGSPFALRLWRACQACPQKPEPRPATRKRRSL